MLSAFDPHQQSADTLAPLFSLAGRTALITGAGRGLGRAIAESFAGAGARVVLCARTRSEVQEVADALNEQGFKARAEAVDVTDHVAFRALVQNSPVPDIFVNNAGANRPMPIADVEEEDFDAVIGLNLRAAFFALQTVARRLLAERRAGSIINMSSQYGHVGGENRALYCASKWGLEGLTKSAALEFAPHAIRVNTIAPTFVETALTAPYFADPTFRTLCLDRIRLGRLGQPSDVVGAALFLASDASALMTGSSIVLDGGWSAA